MKTHRLVPVLAASLALAASSAHALFKVVEPDGRVTYTDRPPQSSGGKVVPVNRDGTSTGDTAALPFALRQVATRFPVTLYTSTNCNPCAAARQVLVRRGIPFAERVADSAEDREAWERIVGGPEAPSLRVGGQVMRGFNAVQWEETLDIAGYPRQSVLPAGYQAPAASPLVERRAAPAAAPARDESPATAPDTGTRPSGFRF